MNSSKYRYTEEEKKDKINEWLVKKRDEKKRLEEKLQRVQEEAELNVRNFLYSH